MKTIKRTVPLLMIIAALALFYFLHQNGSVSHENLFAQTETSPPVPSYSCEGFYAPMDRPVTVKKNRALPLKAQLFLGPTPTPTATESPGPTPTATESPGPTPTATESPGPTPTATSSSTAASTLYDNGYPITGDDIYAPPVVQVVYDPGCEGEECEPEDVTDVTDDAYPAGMGTDGNQFEYNYDDGLWQFNLKTKNYTSPGTYTITMVSGDETGYVIEPTCTAILVVND